MRGLAPTRFTSCRVRLGKKRTMAFLRDGTRTRDLPGWNRALFLGATPPYGGGGNLGSVGP